MSLDATRWAWKQDELKPSEKLVLLAIADRAGEDHTAYPSIQRLEKDSCLNRKTIIGCLDSLELKGLIIDTGNRIGRTSRVKVYQLQGVDCRHINTEKQESSQKRNNTESGTIEGEKGPKNGTTKQSQNRYSESTSEESKEYPPNPPEGGEGQRGDSKKSAVAYQAIADIYNETFGIDRPQVVKLTKNRKTLINARWKETFGKSRGSDLNFWRRYFNYARKSKVLCGMKEGMPWAGATFDWLLNEANMAKVIEGNYHNPDDIRPELVEGDQ